ncbi:MAG TPA: sigma factor, partial [Parapedobacter sp.]|nr:sigma factor [Parapedobacter sp.]
MKSQTSIGDKELLLGLQRGDEVSFTTLYNRYSPSVYLSIIRLVKEREVALDIVQDLFFNIWKNRQAIDVNRPFRPYIFRIAKNLVVDFFRK